MKSSTMISILCMASILYGVNASSGFCSYRGCSTNIDRRLNYTHVLMPNMYRITDLTMSMFQHRPIIYVDVPTNYDFTDSLPDIFNAHPWVMFDINQYNLENMLNLKNNYNVTLIAVGDINSTLAYGNKLIDVHVVVNAEKGLYFNTWNRPTNSMGIMFNKFANYSRLYTYSAHPVRYETTVFYYTKYRNILGYLVQSDTCTDTITDRRY